MRLRRLLTTAAVGLASLVTVAGVLSSAPAGSAATGNVVTPGNFLGFGFDQCHTPSQKAMNHWLAHSPYLAVGIYISGASRGCRDQPNLTPTWVSTQLRKGWKLIPIDVGPQAPCNPRFPRYGSDHVINNAPGSDGTFPKARAEGVAEAKKSAAVAASLGISAGSTLWYDLENFDQTKSRCRNASLAFLSGWTSGLHSLHYVSGVYSSAGSGIWSLDQARIKTPTRYVLPDRIWIARWDGQANTSTSYISAKGWVPGNRMKQYIGGHNETWGGVTINIDRDYLDLGTHTLPAEVHCGGVPVDLPDYPRVQAGSDPVAVKALQCLLSEQKVYAGRLNGRFTAATLAAANTWQKDHGLSARPFWNRRAWMTLFMTGPQPVLKYGSTGAAVRRLQRTLNAAKSGTDLPVTGVFAQMTDTALRAWEITTHRVAEGVVNPGVWAALAAGTRS